MRAKHVAGLALACCATLLLCSRSHADDEAWPEWPTVVPHELLQVAASPLLTAERHLELMRLVDSLAGMRDWDDVVDGPANPPVDAAALEAMAVANPAAAAHRKLFALGPEAIPVLLARLDDRTPTGLSFAYGGFRDLRYGTGLDANLADSAELEAIRSAFGREWPPATIEARDFLPQDESKYTATIGDMAFAVLGAIVGREYAIWPWRFKGSTTVYSPTHDPRIAQAARAQWLGKEARRELARRLTFDFHTRWGDWDLFARLGPRSAQAARLLAAWFGAESEAMLAARLDTCDASAAQQGAEESSEDWQLAELCEAFLDSHRPVLVAAVERFAVRTTRREVLVRVWPGLSPAARELAYPSVEATIRAISRLDQRGHWMRELLPLALDASPTQIRQALEPCLAGTVAAAQVLAWAGHRRGLSLSAAAWAPWLVGDAPLPRYLDKEVVGEAADERKDAADDLPRDTLLRDAVAALIARERVDLPFDLAAERGDRDRAIQHMRRVLAEEASR